MIKEYLEKLFHFQRGNQMEPTYTAEITDTAERMKLFTKLLGHHMGPDPSRLMQLLADAPPTISDSVSKLFLGENPILRPSLEVETIMGEYTAMGFGHSEVFELLQGVTEQLNVSRYADPYAGPYKMAQIHREMQEEAAVHLSNISDYFSPAIDLPTTVSNALGRILSNHHNESVKFDEPEFDEPEL